MGGQPGALQASKGLAKLRPDEPATHNGVSSRKTFHIFVNEGLHPVQLFWYHGHSHEEARGTIQPDGNLYVGSHTFHQWRVKSMSGDTLCTHTGASAVVQIGDTPAACKTTHNLFTRDSMPSITSSIDTAKGRFSVRGTALAGSVPIWAFDCVSQDAVQRVADVTARLLAGCPPSLLHTVMSHNPALAVFGRRHVITDVPAHTFMRWNTGRDLDRTTRGLAGTPVVPMTSCGEENITMIDDELYPCQSILVHELGHTVQNLGMDLHLRTQVQCAYTAALSERLYPAGCYVMTNDHEYWAAGTEAWFESTLRSDVNGGVNTRAKVKAHDPRLAAILGQVYGDGHWRYHHDCPRPLSFKPTRSSSARVVNTKPAVLSSTVPARRLAPPLRPPGVVNRPQSETGSPQGSGDLSSDPALSSDSTPGCGGWWPVTCAGLHTLPAQAGQTLRGPDVQDVEGIRRSGRNTPTGDPPDTLPLMSQGQTHNGSAWDVEAGGDKAGADTTTAGPAPFSVRSACVSVFASCLPGARAAKKAKLRNM